MFVARFITITLALGVIALGASTKAQAQSNTTAQDTTATRAATKSGVTQQAADGNALACIRLLEDRIATLDQRRRADEPGLADLGRLDIHGRARVVHERQDAGVVKIHGEDAAPLSGGQQQRVALARALAVQPRVLLLDEPFGALDARVRKQLRQWLRQLHDEVKVTTILVTHDSEEACEVADRVAVMHEARIAQIGTAAELALGSANPFLESLLAESTRKSAAVRKINYH